MDDPDGTITFSDWLKRLPSVATVAGAVWGAFWLIMIASLSPQGITEWPLGWMAVSLALVLAVAGIMTVSLLEETMATASHTTPKTTPYDSPFVLGKEDDYAWPQRTSPESPASDVNPAWLQQASVTSTGQMEATLTSTEFAIGDKIVYVQNGWEYEVVPEPPNQPLALRGMDIVWGEILPSRTHFRYFHPSEIRKADQ